MSESNECAQTKAGFVIRHQETKWQYTKPMPTEAEACQELDRVAKALAIAVRALLNVSSSVVICIGEGADR